MGGKSWEGALAPKRWPPQRLVGPDGGASPKQPIKGFGREVGKGSGKRIVWWGKLVGRRGWRKWAGQRLGGRKVRGGRRRLRLPTPYAGPPPCSKLVWRGASRPWLGPEVGRATGATFFPALCAGGLCLKEKKALGAHGPEPHA